MSRVDRPSSFAGARVRRAQGTTRTIFRRTQSPRRIWHQTRALARSAGCPGIKGPVPPPVSMVRPRCHRRCAMSIASCGWKDIFSSDTTSVVTSRILAPFLVRVDGVPHNVPRPALHALALTYVGALLACATSTAAQQRWHWHGAAGTTSPGATTSQIAPVPAGSGPSLQLEWQAPAYLAWVVNPLAGPAQIRLSATPSEDYRAVPQLPLTLQMDAHERRLLARLYPASNQRTLSGLGLRAANKTQEEAVSRRWSKQARATPSGDRCGVQSGCAVCPCLRTRHGCARRPSDDGPTGRCARSPCVRSAQ
ncbi:Membrane protein related to metalloendopeptidase [Xanthomonas fragariae]|nr:Membrane protein related to metalloendopeptidase [Xanthomonas fragariae]